MYQKIFDLSKRVLQNELISGSFYLFIGTMVGNVLAFVFNLVIVRYLSYAHYAEITALTSLLTLASIPSLAFLPTIMQFAGRYFAKNQKAEASELFWQSTIKIAVVAFILFVGFVVFSPFLSSFLHITNILEIILVGLVVTSMYLSVTNTAFLQSLLQFQFLAFTLTLGGILKLFIGLGLLFAGFGLVGVLWGYFLSFLIPLLIAFIPLKSIIIERFKKRASIHSKEILTYGLPATIAVFSLSSFTSSDILLVKHFFPSSDAALYSGMALVGKIIFYFSAPISTVMFPLITKKFHKGESIHGILYLSSLLVLLPSFALTLFYFLFPNSIISIVLGKKYFPAAPLLGWFGVYLSLFSLLTVVVNFLLSIKKTSVSYFIAAGAALQIIGITLFHQSLAIVVAISLILSLVLFAVLLLYYQSTYAVKKTH